MVCYHCMLEVDMGHVLRILMLFAMLTAWGIGAGDAQTKRARAAAAPASPASAENAIKERKNAGTVGLASGRLGGAYPILAEEIARVLEGSDTLRVIPMLTHGS